MTKYDDAWFEENFKQLSDVTRGEMMKMIIVEREKTARVVAQEIEATKRAKLNSSTYNDVRIGAIVALVVIVFIIVTGVCCVRTAEPRCDRCPQPAPQQVTSVVPSSSVSR